MANGVVSVRLLRNEQICWKISAIQNKQILIFFNRIFDVFSFIKT